MEQQRESHVFSEIRMATVGVEDISRSRNFYVASFDYADLGYGTVSGPAFGELWQLSEDITAEVLLLGPEGATSGLVRLVKFDSPGELYWGDYSAVQDYGHYALSIRVPEIQAVVTAIQATGGRSKSAPNHLTVTPDLSAWDSMSYDPDDVVLHVFQLEPAPGSLLSEYDGRPSPLQTAAIHSSDANRAAVFYAALGFRPLFDKNIEDIEDLFHLPPDTTLHNINMMQPEEPAIGRFEIVQYVGFPGTTQRDRALPPALGILSVSLETDDLTAAELLLGSIGAEPVGQRVELEMPGTGAVAARSYFGPDGEVLEFYQCL